MRLIHTADWHLGRQFHNLPLLDDQRHVLEQLVALAREVQAEAFVIAGDVFDRAVPGPEAVNLLDEVLAELVLGLGIPVIMIAGNHDSGARLGFGARLLAPAGLHVFGRCQATPPRITLADRFGPVHFVGLPYAEPAEVREASGEAGLQGHAQALAWLTAAARTRLPAGERSICVAHCFVAGGAESESERPLTVGGAASVPPQCFAGFSYTALGHLHRPQQCGPRIEYAGSLLKYSFSEIGHIKSASVVELDGSGAVQVERIPLVPRRDLRLLEGELAALLQGPAPGENAADLLLVRLTDRGALLDPMGRLRELYPHVLHIERPALPRAGREAPRPGAPVGGDQALFAAFYEQVTGAALDVQQSAAFEAVLGEVLRGEREAEP